MIVIGAIIGLAFLAGLAVVLYDLVASPSLRRLAFRNIARRPAEAALVVVGTMLGTAIVTAALIVGDTFENSIVDIGRRELGPIDVRARVDGLDRGIELEQALADIESAEIDGKLALVSTGAAIATVEEEDRRARPFGSMAEVEFDAVRAFGPDSGITGFEDAGPTPGAGQVVISDRLADKLDVEVGERLDLFAYGGNVRAAIIAVLPEVGLGGYSDAYVAPGTIQALVAGAVDTNAAQPSYQILFSNTGGVFEGADHSDTVEALVEQHVAALPDVEVDGIKADLLDDAKQSGDSMGQLFTMIGSFSVLVGILLLVNLFVMLSEERKQELGMLRAVGLKRNHLLRAFGLEGAIYAVLASIVGGFVGIWVGWAISRVTSGIGGGDEFGHIVFYASPASVITGMLIGLVISLVTVGLTSARIARLNVIRAIRDLPEPSTGRPSLRSTVLASLGVLLGLVMFQAGLGAGAGFPILGGPAIALLSAIPLLRRFLSENIAIVVPAVATLIWGLIVFNVSDAANEGGIEVFVAQGVVLVTAGVLLLSTASPAWSALSARLVGQGRGLASHLALAYPLARKVRTGILLAMFSLTVFVLTVMSFFAEIFGGQAESFAESDRGGFDIFIDSNWSNPPNADQLLALEQVTAVAPLVRSFPKFTTEYEPDEEHWSTTGFDQRLVDGGPPKLNTRAAEFASDKAVFEAILAPRAEGELPKAVVPEFFLAQNNGPPEARAEVGGIVTMYSPFGPETQQFEVVGLSDADFLFNGLMTDAAVLRDFLGTSLRSGRFYLQVAPGVDADDFAVQLDGAFLENGVQAKTFLGAVLENLAEQNGFIRLMQGYLALGLLIGVAGLGVVMVRAVRERRRQVGILRAMGFPSKTVRAAYLLEASFICGQGIFLGIGLGTLTSYQLIVTSGSFSEADLGFTVPWFAIAFILVVPLASSLIATVTPAAQAAAIRPAEALRLAD